MQTGTFFTVPVYIIPYQYRFSQLNYRYFSVGEKEKKQKVGIIKRKIPNTSYIEVIEEEEDEEELGEDKFFYLYNY